MTHPLFQQRENQTIANALRGLPDDIFQSLVLAEAERRGWDPDAFGNRIARMGSEAARLMQRGSIV
jgi:hypothetical protein